MRGDDGLFRAADGELPDDPNARVQNGALEGSNVSPVETMVAMITAARQFEQQMKMLQSAEQQEQAARQAAVGERLVAERRVVLQRTGGLAIRPARRAASTGMSGFLRVDAQVRA